MRCQCQADMRMASSRRVAGFTSRNHSGLLVLVLSGLMLVSLVIPGSVEGNMFGAQFDYYDSNIETLDKTDNSVSETRLVQQFQTYTLNLDRNLYPLLRMNLGGVFKNERTRSEQQNIDLLRKQQSLSPRAGLVAGDKPVLVGIDYNGLRREQSVTSAAETEDVRDQVSLFGQWRPNTRTRSSGG